MSGLKVHTFHCVVSLFPISLSLWLYLMLYPPFIFLPNSFPPPLSSVLLQFAILCFCPFLYLILFMFLLQAWYRFCGVSIFAFGESPRLNIYTCSHRPVLHIYSLTWSHNPFHALTLTHSPHPHSPTQNTELNGTDLLAQQRALNSLCDLLRNPQSVKLAIDSGTHNGLERSCLFLEADACLASSLTHHAHVFA